MTRDETAFANAVVFLEDQITDLRTLVHTTPPDEFASWQMIRVLGCLGRAVCAMTDTFIEANDIAQHAITRRERDLH